MAIIEVLSFIICAISVLLSITVIFIKLSHNTFLRSSDDFFDLYTTLISIDPIEYEYIGTTKNHYKIKIFCKGESIILNESSRSSPFDCNTKNEYSKAIIFGRDENCDFIINDATASRQQFSIMLKNNRWLIKDCKSVNGTIVNRKRVYKTTYIKEAAMIVAGNTHFIIKIERM